MLAIVSKTLVKIAQNSITYIRTIAVAGHAKVRPGTPSKLKRAKSFDHVTEMSEMIAARRFGVYWVDSGRRNTSAGVMVSSPTHHGGTARNFDGIAPGGKGSNRRAENSSPRSLLVFNPRHPTLDTLRRPDHRIQQSHRALCTSYGWLPA